MSEFSFLADSEEDTERLGTLLADVLPAGTVIALVGTLGAGKTRLVQAVAAALGVPRDAVTSPTFMLVNEHLGGRLPVYHIDAYRLHDEDEFLELGPEEYFDGAGLTFIEWADRVENCLPADFLRIDIEVAGDTSRLIILSTASENYAALVDRVKSMLGTG